MYKIIYPVQTYINGPNLNDAVKNYVKMHNNMNLRKLIIQNENLYNQSIINYIHKNGKKIAHINTIPLNPQFPLSYYIDKLQGKLPDKLPHRLTYIPVLPTPAIFPPLIPNNFAI